MVFYTCSQKFFWGGGVFPFRGTVGRGGGGLKPHVCVHRLPCMCRVLVQLPINAECTHYTTNFS